MKPIPCLKGYTYTIIQRMFLFFWCSCFSCRSWKEKRKKECFKMLFYDRLHFSNPDKGYTKCKIRGTGTRLVYYIWFINEFLGVNFITATWLVVLLAFQSCSTLYLVEWSMRCRINTPTTNTNMTNMVIEDKQNAGMINFILFSSEIFLAVKDFGTVKKC